MTGVPWPSARASRARCSPCSRSTPGRPSRRSWDEAEQHYRTALAMNERSGFRPWLAHTQADYARMLLARGDSKRAEELSELAVANYRELGMATL